MYHQTINSQKLNPQIFDPSESLTIAIHMRIYFLLAIWAMLANFYVFTLTNLKCLHVSPQTFKIPSLMVIGNRIREPVLWKPLYHNLVSEEDYPWTSMDRESRLSYNSYISLGLVSWGLSLLSFRYQPEMLPYRWICDAVINCTIWFTHFRSLKSPVTIIPALATGNLQLYDDTHNSRKVPVIPHPVRDMLLSLGWEAPNTLVTTMKKSLPWQSLYSRVKTQSANK